MYDNPEPIETEKCFNFKIMATVECKGYVFASNEVEAQELINNHEWTEIDIDNKSISDVDIIDIKED